MTDRELLEAAAKAAGMTNPNYMEIYQNKGINRGPTEPLWNPLTDDGDALRLAVKLQLTICNEHLSAGVAYCTGEEGDVFPEIGSGRIGLDPEIIPDDYAATRRAIVIAAAKVGKQSNL